MAEAIYPGEFPNRPLHSFVNDPSLEEYSKQAEYLLSKFPELFVPRIQYKRPGYKNTCWYVALKEKPDIYIANFTIIPSNLNIELRLPKFFSVTEKHVEIFEMKHQNDLPTFGLKKIGQDTAFKLLDEYIKVITPYVLNGTHKTVGRSSAEDIINHDLKTIFPEYKVRHSERPIRYPGGSFLELDLQIPALKFAIEVQGPTHYSDSDIYGNYEDVKKRDDFKKLWCLEHNIKLMHIEWEGYMKTIYRLPVSKRQQIFKSLVDAFLTSKASFVEVKEKDFREASLQLP